MTPVLTGALPTNSTTALLAGLALLVALAAHGANRLRAAGRNRTVRLISLRSGRGDA